MNGLLQNMPKQAVCDRLITETTLISPRHTLSHPSQRGAGAGHRSCTPVGLEGSDALDGECELQQKAHPKATVPVTGCAAHRRVAAAGTCCSASCELS